MSWSSRSGLLKPSLACFSEGWGFEHPEMHRTAAVLHNPEVRPQKLLVSW